MIQMSANELPHVLGLPGGTQAPEPGDPIELAVGSREVRHRLQQAINDLAGLEIQLEGHAAAQLRHVVDELRSLSNGVDGPAPGVEVDGPAPTVSDQ